MFLAALLLFGQSLNSAEIRASALVAQMTLEEKISRVMHNSKAIPRLGIPVFNWSEGLQGPTVFPQCIGLAATWDPELVFEIGSAVSDEARAKHHDDQGWRFGPETFGEDPVLTATMALQFVRGMQGNDPNYLKTDGD